MDERIQEVYSDGDTVVNGSFEMKEDLKSKKDLP